MWFLDMWVLFLELSFMTAFVETAIWLRLFLSRQIQNVSEGNLVWGGIGQPQCTDQIALKVSKTSQGNLNASLEELSGKLLHRLAARSHLSVSRSLSLSIYISLSLSPSLSPSLSLPLPLSLSLSVTERTHERP